VRGGFKIGSNYGNTAAAVFAAVFISKSTVVGGGRMNITGIGSRSPAPAGSGRAFNAAYQAASQRLLKAQADHESVADDGDGGGSGDRSRRLVASRSREEKAARQLLQRRLELGRILRSSVNDDFMRTVFAGRRVLAERVPRFLTKVRGGDAGASTLRAGGNLICSL